MHLGALPHGRANAPEIGNTLLLHHRAFRLLLGAWPVSLDEQILTARLSHLVSADKNVLDLG